MDRVFFGCHHPGGANAILPVLTALGDRGARCEGVVSRLSQRMFSDFTSSLRLMEERVSMRSAVDILRAWSPNLAIFGTSEPEDPALGKPEAVFAAVARLENIPAVSVLDFWTGYRARFSLPGSAKLDALPDAICVMDDRAKEEMVAEGFPGELLHVTGNPNWDRMSCIKGELAGLARRALKKSMDVGDRKLVLFVSQPLSGVWDGPYDERDVLARVVRSVERVHGEDAVVWVKLHPREDRAVWTAAADKSAAVEFRIMDPGEDTYQAGWAADLIIGMFSMLLIEYALLGLTVVSFQPEVVPDDSVRLGFGVEVISTDCELQGLLRDDQIFARLSPQADFKATERVLDVIEQNLNY